MTKPTSPSTRNIIAKTRGQRHGPVTRVVSPGDIGELTKPFVFLDYFDFLPADISMFPIHPHSGIATVSVLLQGELSYEDSTGATGVLSGGSVEWMLAGNGVWHAGGPASLLRVLGYQIWVALPPELENSIAESQYFSQSTIPQAGPARIVLGSYEGVHSNVKAPRGMNLLHVHLSTGQRWRYQPPMGHTVAWAHVNQGGLLVSDHLLSNEMAIFSESQDAIEFVAQSEADFIIASAVKHPHPLILGRYSVHTTHEALERGEAEIERLGAQIRVERHLRKQKI